MQGQRTTETVCPKDGESLEDCNTCNGQGHIHGFGACTECRDGKVCPNHGRRW